MQELLRRGGALPNADRQKVLEELVAASRRTTAMPTAGKVVFKNQCAKCHVHGGEGTHIGPDLTGMAVHPKEELLAHLIDPSRSVEGNFRVYTVATDVGPRAHRPAGLGIQDGHRAVRRRREEATMLREEIEELVASTKSLMPEDSRSRSAARN